MTNYYIAGTIILALFIGAMVVLYHAYTFPEHFTLENLEQKEKSVEAPKVENKNNPVEGEKSSNGEPLVKDVPKKEDLEKVEAVKVEKSLQLKNAPRGTYFAMTLNRLLEWMHDHWHSNDLFIYPTRWTDNPRHFQMGLLEVAKYSSRILRDNLSRLRTTDDIDKETDSVFVSLSNDPTVLFFPNFENKIEKASKNLESYTKRLASTNQATKSTFYPRSDNLKELLEQYNSLLGGVSTRLSNAPKDTSLKLTEETAGDSLTEGEKLVRVEVSWWEIDDEFYYARGVSYGLYQMLLAIQHDFDDILKLKRADELLNNVIRILQHTQWEPCVVMNGSPDSVFANHLLNLSSRLQDARQKLGSIGRMLEN